MKKKEVISTIMDEDFEVLLAQTNQLEDFQNGEIRCRICHKKIIVDNVGLILPITTEGGNVELEFICNDPDCLTSLK